MDTPKPTPNPTPDPSASPSTPPAQPMPTPGPPPLQIPTIPHVSGVVAYPIQHLLNTARQVQQNAQHALDQLPQMSKQLSNYINGFPETMQEPLTGLMGAYTRRVEHSYATQQLFAAWLELAASEMQKTDGQIKTSFSQFLTDVAQNKIQPNY